MAIGGIMVTVVIVHDLDDDPAIADDSRMIPPAVSTDLNFRYW
ncbi:MAG: hypothetical protein HJJLKODD_02012 [Phycisphaerae bacterium]|nr:hypothetical protein [Phycisphaerae bacterium]